MKYLLAFLLSFNALADCPQKVTPIEKGEVAICEGFLFSDQAEKEASKAKRDAEFHKSVNELLTRKADLQAKEINILERRLNLYVQQSDVLAKNLAQRDNTDSLYKMGYFIVGAVITGVIASNVNR